MSLNSTGPSGNQDIIERLRQAQEVSRQEQDGVVGGDELQRQQERLAQDTATQGPLDEKLTTQLSQEMDERAPETVGGAEAVAHNSGFQELSGEQRSEEVVGSAHRQQAQAEDWQVFSQDVAERTIPPSVEDLNSNPDNTQNQFNAGDLLKQMAIDHRYIKA